jgi:hypothetical protein
MAFILILATVIFFTSPTYQRIFYSKILKLPYPENGVKSQKNADSTAQDKNDVTKTNNVVKIKEKSKPVEKITVKQKIEKSEKRDTIWAETETIIAGISELGARIVSLKMKEYRLNHIAGVAMDSTHQGNNYVEIITEKSPGGAGMIINNISYDSLLFSVESNIKGKKTLVKKGDEAEISFVTKDALGNMVEKQFETTGQFELKAFSKDVLVYSLGNGLDLLSSHLRRPASHQPS